MRAALITIPAAPSAAQGQAAPPVLAGKSLARRQLDFALAAGCRHIIVLGAGLPAEELLLREAAEHRGARFEVIADSTGLSALVDRQDELLVLMLGLLPESPAMIEALCRGPMVLVLPAASGTAAGFERIDLERAWAGAAMVPGALIERLAGLPPDIDPASALMRAALQTHVPEHRVPEALMADGQWALSLRPATDAGADRAWLLRHSALLRSLPVWLSDKAVSFAGRVLGSRQLVPLSWFVAAVPLGTAILFGWLGYPAAGLILVALGAILARAAQELAALRQAPFGRAGLRQPMVAAAVTDLAITLCACLAIEGTWLQRLFPPLLLMAAMHLPATSTFAAAVRRRPLLAAGLAVATAFGFAEVAIMGIGLALVILAIPSDSREPRITRD
jgi:hypothetical protein